MIYDINIYNDKDNDNDIDNPVRPGQLFKLLATSWDLCSNNNKTTTLATTSVNNCYLLLRHIHGFTQNESYLHVKFFIIRHFTSPFTIVSSKQMQRIVSMESNEAEQCKFLKHIYWNFMESVISKIWNRAQFVSQCQ